MGRPKAMEMLCFGRKINAYEAKERNLVSCIYPHETFQTNVQVRISIVQHSNELQSYQKSSTASEKAIITLFISEGSRRCYW